MRIIRVLMREERTSVTMVRADQPEHELDILGFGDARHTSCQADGESLVTPVLRQFH
jgi:hypothetical protein